MTLILIWGFPRGIFPRLGLVCVQEIHCAALAPQPCQAPKATWNIWDIIALIIALTFTPETMNRGHQEIMYNNEYYGLVVKCATLFKRQLSHRKRKKECKKQTEGHHARREMVK